MRPTVPAVGRSSYPAYYPRPSTDVDRPSGAAGKLLLYPRYVHEREQHEREAHAFFARFLRLQPPRLVRGLGRPELLKLQADIIAALAPFTAATGPIGAFTAGHDNAAIDTMMIDYVSTFVQKAAGEHFNPHVSTGTAPRADLDKLLAEPFTPFTFSPAGAAVYQLGPFGTAAKKLKEWDLKQ